MSLGKTSLFHEYQGQGFYLAQFKTPELAIYSYYLESQGQALLIDPTFDVYEYAKLANKRNSKIISVALTHYHADYVSGHSQFNLPIIMGPESKVNSQFKIYQMKDNYTFNLGKVWLKILHSPGHTLESSCFRLFDKNGKQSILFTGDTIFLGDTGRPDLAVATTRTKQDLAAMLFHSINKIKKIVDHSVKIYPTHGAGSSCGKSIGQGNFCTLEKQLQSNFAFKIESQAEFIEKICSQIPQAPAYFCHVASLNSVGHKMNFQKVLNSCSRKLSIQQFKKQIEAGCLVIDSRQNFGGVTIKGSYLMAEGGTFANWVGLLISPEDSVVLICTDQKEKDIIERMIRIGYENIKGCANFTIEEWKNAGNQTSEFSLVNAKQLSEIENKNILDVRNLPQWKTGIIENAKLISLSQIKQRGNQVKDTQNLYVHCKTGGRARLASSILAQKGIKANIVAEKFEEFEAKGLKIVPYE